MIPVSVVMITKNEASVIAATIAKAKLITHDIVVVDNGSTDGTVQIAREAGCRVYQKSWDGYAANKNKGIELAEHDWILSLDADEVPDDELINTLHHLSLTDAGTVYDLKFKSYFGAQQIRFGKWGRDHHVRLFNRTQVKWSDSPVHETLDIPHHAKRQRVAGHIQHYSVKDAEEFRSKSANYSLLSAKKYYIDGKHSSVVKLYLSPLFNFIKNYVFYLGFLDGKAGWEIASVTFNHTWYKYHLLNQLEQKESTPIDKVFIDDVILVNY